MTRYYPEANGAKDYYTPLSHLYPRKYEQIEVENHLSLCHGR